MTDLGLPGYRLKLGSGLQRALLVKFMQRTYQEFAPQSKADHIAQAVDAYLAKGTCIWWVEPDESPNQDVGFPGFTVNQPVACLWLGTSVDQVQGDSHTHIFLLYVVPEQRRRGIGTALLRYAQAWAKAKGDRQLGLQVFQANQPALTLYQKMGFQVQALLMTKPL